VSQTKSLKSFIPRCISFFEFGVHRCFDYTLTGGVIQ
jgi:hypothetical protein